MFKIIKRKHDNEMKKTEKEYDIAFRKYLSGDYSDLTREQKKIFCNNKYSFDNTKITLKSLCDGLGIKIPKKFKKIADEPQTVAFRSKRVKPGDICLIIRSAEEFKASGMTSKDQYELAIQNGAKIVIMGKNDFKKTGLNEKKLPVILMDNNNERILHLFSSIRKQQNAKVVMITGSIGKTTTKDICYAVTKNRFKTFANKRNTNTPHQVAKHLFYNTNPNNEVYIQETGAGFRDSVRFSASMLQPDIFILTNVVGHHLQVYKTFENIFKEKVSADDYLSNDGVIITNFDDINIRKHNFKHKVISFAIEYENADYRALNIQQNRDYLTFDILESATGRITKVGVNILGEHNVYNILAAFVLAKVLGISETDFQNDIAQYRSEGVRQNLVNVGGVYINLDCYNSAEESIMSMLEAGEKFKLESNGKKYAIIGGENKLGKQVIQRSEAFGKKLAKIKMDKFLFCGTSDRSIKALNYYGDAGSIKKTFEKVSNVTCEFSTSVEDIERFLKENVNRNDLVLFKGVAWLDMPIAIDRVFGTSFSFSLSNYKETMEQIYDEKNTANLIKEFGKVELVSVSIDDGVVNIPDYVNSYPVFRLADNIFENNDEISEIFFGNELMNIGKKAFYNCSSIKHILISENIKIIEDQAFGECTGLKEVILKEGVTHIGEKAFEECKNLEKIHIPSTTGLIEKNAFNNCDKVTIMCRAKSYAHDFAIKNNIKFCLYN